MSDDAKEYWAAVKNLHEEPSYDIADAHIKPDEVKIHSGMDLHPKDVIEATRREVQNLIDFDAFEWVCNEDIDKNGKWINSRWEDLAKSDPTEAACEQVGST